MKKMLAILLLAAMLLCAFAGCKKEENTFVSQEKAQQIAMEDLGVTADQVTEMHTHVGQHEGAPAFSIHITVGGRSYEYVIRAIDGKIGHVGDSTH